MGRVGLRHGQHGVDAVRPSRPAERASTAEEFWDAHITRITRSHTLTDEDLEAVAWNWDFLRKS